MPRRKGSTKAERNLFRAIRAGKVGAPMNDWRIDRAVDMIQRDAPFLGQEAIAEHLGISVETLRRKLRTSPAWRAVICRNKAGVYRADAGELLNLRGELLEARSDGQRGRQKPRRSKLGLFSAPANGRPN